MCWDAGLPGPAGGVVDGLVAGQGVRDLVRAVCQRAGDDSAVFPAGPEPCRVGPDLWVAVPEPVPEIDQRAAELQAALPADPAVPAVAGGLVLHWGQPRRPVQLRGPGHQRVGSPTPHHKKPPASPPPGRAGQRAERAGRHHYGRLILGLGDLLVQVGQQHH